MPDGTRNIPERTRPSTPIEKIRALEDTISARLERDGMLTGKYTGKAYLIDLIILAVQNGGMSNYVLKDKEQIVADKYKTTRNRVFRNIYTAINKTYDYITITGEYESEVTPFKRGERHRTPFSIISYYAEIFRNALN